MTIVDVVRYYNPGWEPPRDNGKEWLPAHCAFHDDTTKSAAVSYEHDAYRCLGCCAKGNSVTLIMNQEGLNYREAIERYEEIAVGSDSEIPRKLPGSPAEEYLAGRGLTGPALSRFGLGYVAEPSAEHAQFAGFLAIPYLRNHPEQGWLTVSIRFRRLNEGTPKYMTQAGDRPRLYNTPALLQRSRIIAIAEGEIDAITAEIAGIPCVGVPGVQTWQPYYREPFLGYGSVYVLADGDEPGMTFANTVARSLPNARIVPMPEASDVNQLVNEHGADALRERIGL